MPCKLCQSGHQQRFRAEIKSQSHEFEDLEKPSLLVFLQVAFFLGCRSTEFLIPEIQTSYNLQALPSCH